MNICPFKISQITHKICLGLTAVIIAFLFVNHACAANLDDANRAFTENRFQDSTTAFESVLKENGYSAPVLFDLGNSYFHQGNLGDSILAYKRAQWLQPNDPDIAVNLQLAQQKAGLPPQAESWFESVTHWMSSSAWAWTGSAALMLLCGSILAMMFFSRLKSTFRLFAVMSALVITLSLVSVIGWSGELRQAIVIEKDASALISPFPKASVAFSLPIGATVTLGKIYGDFVLVHDPNGGTGWVNKSQVGRIIPYSQ